MVGWRSLRQPSPSPARPAPWPAPRPMTSIQLRRGLKGENQRHAPLRRRPSSTKRRGAPQTAEPIPFACSAKPVAGPIGPPDQFQTCLVTAKRVPGFSILSTIAVWGPQMSASGSTKPAFAGLSEVGGTGLEPVTPSLSSLPIGVATSGQRSTLQPGKPRFCLAAVPLIRQLWTQR
jgi:hypothetical protein